MKEIWYGCPNCFLAFSQDSEYKRHIELEHPKKKGKTAARLASAIDY